MALLAFMGGLGSLAQITQGTPDDPHAPITIDGDAELRTNVCACIRNPGASGTADDPYNITDWRIETPGTAIEIKNIQEEHFVIRDNSLEASTSIRLVNTGNRGTIVENTADFKEVGIELENSSPWVSDNKLLGPGSDVAGSQGLTIEGGSPTFDGNIVKLTETGIQAESSSPHIEENEIQNVYDAARLTSSTDARLENNTVSLVDNWGLHVSESAKARLIGNEIREGQGGIIVDDADLHMQNNTVTNQKAEAVRFERANVVMLRNTIANNWRGAFGSTDSDVTIVENVFRDNGDSDGPNDNAGLRLEGSEGDVVNNTVVGNDIGIRLDRSIISLEDNELRNNTWGMSIPYSSKGSIPLMSGNYINGVNVDGTEVPSDQRIFYEQDGASLNGQTVDSGADHYGTLFKQGAVVIYDSDDMTLQDNSFEGNHRAIYIQGNRDRVPEPVRIRSNTFVGNVEAVVTKDSETFIKDNICEIEIDPDKTICFEAKSGFVTVRANLVANVHVGVFFHADARGVIAENTIKSTVEAGLRLAGDFDQTTDDVQVLRNNLEANVVGAVLLNFRGQIEANTIGNSTQAAVQLDQRSNATFEANTIVFNEVGVVDRDECHDSWRVKCSTGVFVDNRFKHNDGVAVRLENGGSFEGDVFVGNEIGADLAGESTMTRVNVTHSSKTGIRASGQLTLEEANVSANGKDGVRVDGQLLVEDVNASANARQGIDVRGELSAENVTASFNEETGIHVEGRAGLEVVFARNNSEDGAELIGSANVAEGNFSGNAEAGLRLGGTLFVVQECEASFNADGVVMVEGDVEISPHVPIPSVPSVEIPDTEEDDDPLWMHECDLVANEDHALRANIEARVNATHNFWGKKGPVIDTPVIPGENVVSANARVSPYYESRDHDVQCVAPANEASVDTPQGCVDP